MLEILLSAPGIEVNQARLTDGRSALMVRPATALSLPFTACHRLPPRVHRAFAAFSPPAAAFHRGSAAGRGGRAAAEVRREAAGVQQRGPFSL